MSMNVQKMSGCKTLERLPRKGGGARRSRPPRAQLRLHSAAARGDRVGDDLPPLARRYVALGESLGTTYLVLGKLEYLVAGEVGAFSVGEVWVFNVGEAGVPLVG
eukprot:gene14409-biopygen2338